ncbi:hypothetical protein [Malonomonas rubra]|uniref:hypothetical protein n=1 Tax=Malonomonas rubra TaxID=57040 RepID=UPI0026EF942A|nr:hypothetical protein [Malonomonas rubra]
MIITENGEDALAVLEAKPARLLIFDVHLPARDAIAPRNRSSAIHNGPISP